jgi:putative ABC transport system substrate-binding protein
MSEGRVRRRDLILGLGGTAAMLSQVALAQKQMPLIGVLGSASAAADSERLRLIRQGLAEIGFTENLTLTVEYRWAEGQLDRLPAMAAELVDRKVSVIIATGGLQAPRAAMSATSTIPIVFSTDGNPVKQGLVSSLNQPGGNATGITAFSASLTAKRIEMLSKLVPGIKILGVLINPTAAQATEQIQEAKETAGSFGFEVRVLTARNDTEFDQALSPISGLPDAALLISADPLFLARREILIATLNRHAIPAIYGRRDFVAAGGLVSYGANSAELYRLMGTYAGRILKGEKPGNLPVVQPSKFELVINLKIAKALGLELPADFLALSDEVIE